MQEIQDTTVRKKPVSSFILHLHPKKVREETLRFKLTWGLGGMAALLMVLQVFTGLLLRFHYEPSPGKAYDSILFIQHDVLFGQLARNLHYWGAIFLVCLTFLHTLRVIFTGAYRPPRHKTWTFGVILLVLVIFSNFTGYLLPWDQLSYWAITISTHLIEYIPFIGNDLREGLLGGEEVGSITLSNFFHLHTGVISLFMTLFAGYHFWRIRKGGGVIVPQHKANSPMVNTSPHLVAREFVVAMVLIAFLLWISVFLDAPLRERANPAYSPNPAKAPWYFMGIQELLIHFHPFFSVVLIPLSILIAAFGLPYIKLHDSNHGIWFLSSKGKKAGKISALFAFMFTVIFVMADEFLPDPESIMPEIPAFFTTGVMPFAIVLGIFILFLKILKNKFQLNRSEIIQSLVIILVIFYSVLSVIGIWFRGEGMVLTWP